MRHKRLKEKHYLIWTMVSEGFVHCGGKQAAEHSSSQDSQEVEEEAADCGPGRTVFLWPFPSS